MQTRNCTFIKAIEDLSGNKFKKAVAIARAKPKTAQKKIEYFPDHTSAYKTLMERMAGWLYVTGWFYKDAKGYPVYCVYRFERNGDKSYRPIGQEKGKGWFIGRPKCKLPVYNLTNILNSRNETVWIVEGEKPCDALTEIGLLATTSAGGANSARGTDWGTLAGRKIIVWADNDKSGLQYAHDIQKILSKEDLTIWQVPDMKEKEDAYEWVQSRKGKNNKQMLQELRDLWGKREKS